MRLLDNCETGDDEKVGNKITDRMRQFPKTNFRLEQRSSEEQESRNVGYREQAAINAYVECLDGDGKNEGIESVTQDGKRSRRTLG